MADVRRLMALGVQSELAKELANQMEAEGSFTQAGAQADSTATTIADLRTDFNALLAKLRTAGVIAE